MLFSESFLSLIIFPFISNFLFFFSQQLFLLEWVLLVRVEGIIFSFLNLHLYLLKEVGDFMLWIVFKLLQVIEAVFSLKINNFFLWISLFKYEDSTRDPSQLTFLNLFLEGKPSSFDLSYYFFLLKSIILYPLNILE